MPIVPMGFGMDRPKRMRSWDQFAMPRPFSRIRCVVGSPIYLPSNLSRDDLEVARLRVQGKMNELTQEAEDWAESGAERQGDNAERRRTRVRQTVSSLPVDLQPRIAIAQEMRRSA
jgi:hypothetical protein